MAQLIKDQNQQRPEVNGQKYTRSTLHRILVYFDKIMNCLNQGILPYKSYITKLPHKHLKEDLQLQMTFTFLLLFFEKCSSYFNIEDKTEESFFQSFSACFMLRD